MHECLLLNANAQPLSFLPISSISWQQAIKLLYLDAASALHHYDDWVVHSPSATMQVPAVAILRKQVHNVREWIPREGGPQKSLVFLRDLFICQYCDHQFPRNQLTLDHVVPRKYGGRSRWENLATCCSACNGERGCDIRMQPKTKPFRPTFSLLIKHMRMFPLTVAHRSWNWFLGWDDSQLRVIDVRRHSLSNDNFDFGVRVPVEC
jgi:5-methylcytosine-specific restriction endonuclease McrA